LFFCNAPIRDDMSHAGTGLEGFYAQFRREKRSGAGWGSGEL